MENEMLNGPECGFPWAEAMNCAVTVCDKEGDILQGRQVVDRHESVRLSSGTCSREDTPDAVNRRKQFLYHPEAWRPEDDIPDTVARRDGRHSRHG